MILQTFDPNKDIVAGRTTRVASGFWPNGLTTTSQSNFVSDFWSLTGSTGNPSYGTSYFDVRRTMYYLNVFPDSTYFSTDPYLSIAYGNIYGDIGSGSFSVETASILVSPTKAIYTQYKNMLLGTSDLDGMFTMKSGSTTVNATDIWVIDFSAYKMKDRVDEGLLEFSVTGSSGSFALIDDSPYTAQNQLVYNIIAGNLTTPPSSPIYEGLGLFYPSNGVIVLNAALLSQKVGISYNPGLETTLTYTYNHQNFFLAMQSASALMNVRKSEYVPARHYFVRVMNRDFNYSNNPTYVYDGTDGIHAKGTIRNSDFITDPKTYITTVGLYDDSSELVAVAKLSRPAVKDFSTELLIKVRLDF
jgi:hypothetical protein